jgi:hypothetical protein
MQKYLKPYRLGKSNIKAVLDAKGLHVITFKNSETNAKLYCDYLNGEAFLTPMEVARMEKNPNRFRNITLFEVIGITLVILSASAGVLLMFLKL